MKPIRVGVIGLGQRIAHVLRAMQDVGFGFSVAGYADPAPVGVSILKERDIDPGQPYKGAETLLKDGPFDLVMIGSPNHLHFEHLLAAFEAGYPSFGQQPNRRTEEKSLALARADVGARRP